MKRILLASGSAVMFLVFLVPAYESAMADPVSVTFSTQGSWDNVSFSDSLGPITFGNPSNNFTVSFTGVDSTVGSLPAIDVLVGSFSFAQYGNGANSSGDFYLKVIQETPSPGGIVIFSSTVNAKIGSGQNGNPFTVTFDDLSLTVPGNPDVTYTLSSSYSVENSGALPLYILGSVTDPPIAATPEPSTLLLLGTGLAVLPLLARRRRG